MLAAEAIKAGDANEDTRCTSRPQSLTGKLSRLDPLAVVEVGIGHVLDVIHRTSQETSKKLKNISKDGELLGTER